MTVYRLLVLTIVYIAACQGIGGQLPSLVNVKQESACSPINLKQLRAVKTVFSNARPFYSLDSDWLASIWKKQIDVDSFPSYIRKGADDSTLILIGYATNNAKQLRVLAISDALYEGHYDNVRDIWFDITYRPVAWYSKSPSQICFGEGTCIDGAKVHFDPTGRVFALHDRPDSYRVSSCDAPTIELLRSSLTVYEVYYANDLIYIFGASPVKSGANKLFYQKFGLRPQGEGAYELMDECAIFVEGRYGESKRLQNLHVVDLDITSNVVVLRDKSFELFPFLQAFIAYDLEKKKVLDAIDVSRNGFFLQLK